MTALRGAMSCTAAGTPRSVLVGGCPGCGRGGGECVRTGRLGCGQEVGRVTVVPRVLVVMSRWSVSCWTIHRPRPFSAVSALQAGAAALSVKPGP
ncbi:hypothetical protein GCM10010358_81040 [Streptomyces minutiscleroticus]|uniref:Uncharacterized protein n=1 Tax=Streptomyces minutiscleroticus TaxID=68238 RepID=A0A918P452_9ACTN|nr:hypothetical protein GCM10010358_81040 [Streptomyces minutiscleroticus]